MNEKWFKLSIADIEKKLKTNAASGLSRKAARSRGNRGAGHLFYLPKKSVWRLILDILSDFSLIILLIGACVSLAFEIEEHIMGITVLLIAIGALVLCTVMYFRSQRMMESLSSFFYPSAKVIRGGKLYCVDFRSVVVGDVILLEAGDVLCVDARLVTSENLCVNMRISRDEYIMLEKQANGVVAPNEQRAKEMINMVHGGSVISKGSARAIVTAVGKYTYLGAMTGGISLPVSNTQPKLLHKLRKHCSVINMIMLIAVLPFSLISLLLANFLPERESLLSVAFLTGLAIAATTMSQLMCVLLRLYYTHKIRRLVMGNNAAVMKSVEAFDKLSSADYIFMLDGCAATDGIAHFHSAFCAEGEIRHYSSLNRTATVFSEYVSLYYSVATQSLTTGISGAGECFIGIGDFVKKCNVDIEALRIRCKIHSYMAGNMIDAPESIAFTDMGRSYCLNVWKAPEAIGGCKTVLIGGKEQPLSTEGIKKLKQTWRKHEADGETPVLFTLSSGCDGQGVSCFIGQVILKEGVDPYLTKNISRLEKLGCKVISFIRHGNSPKLPPALSGRGCVVKASFERNKLPITYNFGSINTYAGFSDYDIVTLVNYAHSQNKRVVVIGFGEAAAKIAAKADGFVTCSSITPKVFGYLNEEIHSSELAGQEGSGSCLQTVKERADCIVARPKAGKGGLGGLVLALAELRSVYSNISDYIRYIMSVQLIRLVIVGCPMLLGNAILDARHVLLCSYVLDMFVFFSFMLRKGIYTDKRDKDYCNAKSLRDYFSGDRELLLSGIISSVAAILLPVMADFVIGNYNYWVEGMFTSILLMHITSFVLVYYGRSWQKMKYIYKNKLLLIEFGVVLLLWMLCFSVQPIGVLFGIEGWMSAVYFVISIVPSAVQAVIFVLLTRKKQIKNF